MELYNQIGIETNWGFRTFELHQGNLMHVDWEVDVLVISSYERSYLPTPGTVVESLEREHNLIVGDLVEDAALDYRQAFGCWLSRPLSNGPFQRILCVETPEGESASTAVEAAIENLFVMLSIMETKGYRVESLAMPLLGAGAQQLKPVYVLQNLLPASLSWLERSRDLEKISFVEIDPDRARALDEAMNDVLERVDVTLQTDDIVGTVCKELITQLHRLERNGGQGKNQLIHELRHTLRKKQIRSYEIGILSRRMVEHILDDLAGNRGLSGALYKQINQSSEWGVASWVRSYMHVLRLFGNEAAHEKTEAPRHPPEMSSSDLAICLFCLQRVVGFWEEAREKWESVED